MANLYLDRYNIGISIEGNNLDYSPSNYSFILKDSIKSLYSTASITFKDLSGQVSEYLTMVDGIKVEITYGLKDSTMKCPFVVMRNSTPEQITPTNAGGIMEIPLIHEYFYNQSKQSTAYKDEISSIIKKKIGNFNFNSTDIDTTLNKGIWYQPYITDAEFMVDRLLPFAFSSDCEDSPFYMFIDTNNNFYFKSYKKLFMDSKSVLEMKLVPDSSIESYDPACFYTFNSTQSSILELRDQLSRLLFNFDEDSAYVDEQDSIDKYPSSQSAQKYIPIKWNTKNILGINELLSFDDDSENTKNNNSGLKNNSMKKSFSIDRCVISTNLNPSLSSGKKISLNLPIGSDTAKTESSVRHSGDYMIETAYHKWTGSIGRTILVCSRKSIKVPNNYKRSTMIISKG